MTTTRRQEQRDLVNGDRPSSSERLTEYSIFLTDAFANNQVALTYLDSKAIPTSIDGFENDDSYRQSRWLIRRGLSEDRTVNNNLRENSLARQIATKKDQPATIRLIRRLRQSDYHKQTDTDRFKPWENLIPPNTKFFLEQVQENREEKVQVIDTFGEWVAFFFGRRPEVYSYAGTLLNSSNHDWRNEFQENYDNFLRGSKAVENRATMLIQYDDVVVEGYMMNCAISQTAMSNHAVPFSFNLLVINRSPMNPQLITYLRYKRSSVTDAERLLYENMQSALDLLADDKPDELETFLIMREFFSGNYLSGAGNVLYLPASGNLEETTSVTRGQKGGYVDTVASNYSFSSSFTDAIAAAEEEAGVLE